MSRSNFCPVTSICLFWPMHWVWGVGGVEIVFIRKGSRSRMRKANFSTEKWVAQYSGHSPLHRSALESQSRPNQGSVVATPTGKCRWLKAGHLQVRGAAGRRSTCALNEAPLNKGSLGFPEGSLKGSLKGFRRRGQPKDPSKPLQNNFRNPSNVRDGETTIKIKCSLLRGGGLGGREENCPKTLVFVGNATTIKFRKCRLLECRNRRCVRLPGAFKSGPGSGGPVAGNESLGLRALG